MDPITAAQLLRDSSPVGSVGAPGGVSLPSKKYGPLMTATGMLSAASLIPGVGDFIGPVADAAMYYDKPETRTPGNFALSTLGLLPFVPGMTVFHGSPYKFDKFDISKIGTGEGAQAKGWGLYFAEHPAVAKEYQKILSENATRAVAKNKKLENLDEVANRLLSNGDLQIGNRQYKANEAMHLAGDIEDGIVTASMLPEWARNRLGESAEKVSGALYTVDLPDEAIDRMLDWDAPFSAQPESVKQALKSAGLNPPSYRSGQSLYSDMWLIAGKDRPATELQQAASERLLELGIPGIKYLDQGSRASGQGTRNFVVFDDKLAKILKRE